MMESRQIRNPFPGLRPFETDEYRLFFGREGQSDELLAKLQLAHFLAVVGTSGSGKSSLIRAGLLPALRGGLMAGVGSGWRIAVMRPGGDPIGHLAREIVKKDVLPEAGGGLLSAEAESVIDATLRGGSLGLVDVARQGRLAEHEKLLVVVDQFEELFRFRAARERTSTGDEASAFVKLLLEASQQRELSIYVVLTMRSDFLGDCAQFQGLPEAINEGQYLIPRMTRDERRFAVTGPVGVTRGKITEPLVNRLMNDVGDNPDQLPILQHALMRTWDYWQSHRRNGEPIGVEHYEAIGAMSDALSLHADEAFNELPDERSRLIAERLFKALSERGADNREIRRPTSLSAICAIAGASLAEVAAVIEVFRGGGRSFLMPPAAVALRPDTVIDISHESLIRNWLRLQDWVNDEAQSARIYRRLAEAAVLHREGSEGFLQDPGLQIALDWRDKSKPTAAWPERYHPELDESIAYLEASRTARDAALAESERRRNEELERERREREQAERYAAEQARAARRLRWLAVGMAVMFLLALGTAAFAMAARKQAIDSEKKARDAQASAEKAAREVAEGATLLKEQKEEAEGLAVRLGKQKHETDLALLAEQAAVEAQKKALALQKQATARANDQKLAAESSQRDAQTNFVVAMVSQDRSARHFTGIAEFQRGSYDQALQTLKSAMEGVDYEEKASRSVNYPSQEKKDFVMNELKSIRGSVLRDIAATQRKLGKYEDAVRSYIHALQLQTEHDADIKIVRIPRVNEEEERRLRVTWNMFDSTYGLAQAYHDLADERSRIDKTKRDDEDYLKAENYYKQSLALQENLLHREPNVSYSVDSTSGKTILEGKQALQLAGGLENLARFYRDLGRYHEAEPYYDQILRIRSQQRNSSQYLDTLREIARFYRSQNRQAQAEAKYEEVLTILESRLLNASKGFEDTDTMRQLADAYSEMGEALAAQSGKELNSRYAFQLARALQANDLWARQSDRAGLVEDNIGPVLVNIESMGDAWVGLGRDYLAGMAYYDVAKARGGGDPEQFSRLVIKIGRIYGKSPKTYKDAEDAYLLFVNRTEDDPAQSLCLAEGLQELGVLYANALNEPGKAEDALKRSREIVQHAPKESTAEYVIASKRLMEISPQSANANDPGRYIDNRALAELAKLYQRQNKTVEAENAYKLRLENASTQLANAYTSLGAGDHGKSYDEAVREFLDANRALADFYLAYQKKTDALTVYRAMLGDPAKDSNPPTCCIPLNSLADYSVIELYTQVLDHYQQLLVGRETTEEAAKVAGYLEKVNSRMSRHLMQLGRLYQEQNKTVEAENAYKLRLENASRQLANAHASLGTEERTKNYAGAAQEFLEANRELAGFYLTYQKKIDALAVYRAMLGDPEKASNPPTCCIPLNDLADPSVLEQYAQVLDHYQRLLVEREMTEEAAKVAGYLEKINDKLTGFLKP